MTTVVWLRRDLRLADHEALTRAAARGPVVLLFVLDPVLLNGRWPGRTALLGANLRALEADTDGRLWIRFGVPAEVVPRVAAEVGADLVMVTEDFGPYGRRRDAAVTAALNGIGVRMTAVGTSYAVRPGTVMTGAGTSFKVFTPFRRAWVAHGWPAPLPVPPGLDLVADSSAPGSGSRVAPTKLATLLEGPLPSWISPAEAGAVAALDRFVADGLDRYDLDRDRPDLDSTSRISPHLRFGTVHPRTVLDRLAPVRAHEVLRSELAWREFYADVLFAHPDSARVSMSPKMRRQRIDDESTPRALERFAAWCAGRTGYPIVDAGMRQLRAEGFMHNRVRMIVASFLVKDLHLPWQWGADHFMIHLLDGDLASNSHGWQWTAGTGTDAAPYFRIFNPVTQGEKFDPDGDYVRRWVPELGPVEGRGVHRPWALPSSQRQTEYPDPIVDHAHERNEALHRLAEVNRLASL